MKVIKDLKNDLLNRREVKLVMVSSSNPGNINAIKYVSEHFKAGEEVIAVKEVKSKFGRDSFLIDANIYDSEDDKKRIEPKKKEKTGGNK